jgi:hypothetical protein
LHLIELLAEAGDLGLDFGITSQQAEQPNARAASRVATAAVPFGALMPRALLIFPASWARSPTASISTCAR